MTYWIHVAHSIDRVTLHRDRCSEVPSTQTSTDYLGRRLYDYPDKERALAAMEQAGPTDLRRCPPLQTLPGCMKQAADFVSLR
jgi:hypothetical protein